MKIFNFGLLVTTLFFTSAQAWADDVEVVKSSGKEDSGAADLLSKSIHQEGMNFCSEELHEGGDFLTSMEKMSDHARAIEESAREKGRLDSVGSRFKVVYDPNTEKVKIFPILELDAPSLKAVRPLPSPHVGLDSLKDRTAPLLVLDAKKVSPKFLEKLQSDSMYEKHAIGMKNLRSAKIAPLLGDISDSPLFSLLRNNMDVFCIHRLADRERKRVQGQALPEGVHSNHHGLDHGSEADSKASPKRKRKIRRPNRR